MPVRQRHAGNPSAMELVEDRESQANAAAHIRKLRAEQERTKIQSQSCGRCSTVHAGTDCF